MKKFAFFLALTPLACGGLRQVWELQFGVRIKEPAGWAIVKAHPILAAAFSPDGKQLAVAVDDHTTLTSNGTHVLVMDVAAPDRALRQYDVDSCGAPLEWSPGGEAILVCGYVLKLPGGESCRTVSTRASSVTPPFAFEALAHQIYWLSSRRILRSNPSDQDVLDEDCREIDRWESNWRIIGAAAARNWVLQARPHPPRMPQELRIARDEVSVVDAESHRTLAGWPQTVPAFSPPRPGPPRFVVGAAALCLLWGDADLPSECWNVDGGQEIRLAKGLRSYRLVGDSVSSPRILVERLGIGLLEHLDILPSQTVQRRAVWDLRAGREIASWRPGEQTDRVWPYGNWLSPDGHFVAQGGEGNLRLYRLD